jgi:hypothetical protein
MCVQSLPRFLKGELSADAVEEWANLIECREDIDFEPELSIYLKGEISMASSIADLITVGSVYLQLMSIYPERG